MRSAECGIPVPRSNRECGQSRQCQPLNSAFLIPHSALSGGPMFPGLAPRGQCVVCGCVDSSRATCARRSARIRQSSANAATVRTSAAASVGIQWSRRSIMAPEGGERSNQRRRSKCPEDEHPFDQVALHLRQPLLQLGVEAGEVELIQFAQIGAVRGIHGVRPGHKGKCGMRSAECGIAVPRSNRECGRSSQCRQVHSAFRTPH